MYSGGTRVFENGDEIAWCKAMSDDERKKQRARYYSVLAKFVKEHKFEISDSTYDPKKDSKYKVGDDFGLSLDPPPKPAFLDYVANAFSSLIDFFSPVAEPICPKKKDPGDATYNCMACASSNCQVCFKRAIISSDATDKLCIRKTGRYAGFLVNSTSLDDLAGNDPDPENSEDRTCDTPVNVDPEKLPGIVLPRGYIVPKGDSATKAAIGDVVVGYNPKSGKWAFGIVSDGGPEGRLGEASIAFNRILQFGYGGSAAAPRPVSYRPDLLGKDYQPSRPIMMLLLPGTKAKFRIPGHAGEHKAYDFSPATVAKTSRDAFLSWASTTDIDVARRKFSECIGILKQ